MNRQKVRAPIRRSRAWAPTADGITSFARSAQQLARISAGRIARPEIADCLQKYRYATAIERGCKLICGDLLVELIDTHDPRAIDIARETGERPGDLSEMYTVAKTFKYVRPKGIVYNHLLRTTRMVRKFRALKMTPVAALKEILRIGLT
jgi:hypothetical protein